MAFFGCLTRGSSNVPCPLWIHIPEDDAFVYTIKWNHLRFATRAFEWIHMESPYLSTTPLGWKRMFVDISMDMD